MWNQHPLARGSQDTACLAGQLSATVLTPSFHVLLPMALEYVSYWFRGKRNHFLEGHELSEVGDSSEPAAGLPCAQGFYSRMRVNSLG